MSVIRDVVKETRRIFAGHQAIREEDRLRTLAVNERKGFRLPIIYGNNDYILARDSAWTGFAVPNKSWGFLDESERRRYFHASNTIYDRIFPAGKENAGHLLVTNQVYSADEWEQSLLERYRETAGTGFGKYVRKSRETIEQREFFDRECYLFTRLGARGNPGGLKGFLREVIETLAMGAGLDDAQPDTDEQTFWSKQSRSAVDNLSTSWLNALPIHRRRVEWLVRHLDTPGLPTPDVAPADDQEWGAGFWRTTLASYTEEVDLGVVGKDRYRCVEFEAPTGAGKTYAAYLPVSNIPAATWYGQNWAHHASSLNFPVDVSLHFEIIDPERAEKDLETLVTAAEAQEEEDREAGFSGDETVTIQRDSARRVKTNVQMNAQPLVYWQAVFCVYDTDKEELLSKVTRLVRHYKEIQFKLECPRNDQRELFYQSMPGSDILVQDWMHRTDTKYLAAAMPWLTSTVGDRDEAHGLYQGHTIVHDANGVPQKGVPVFYDLQNVVDDEGKAPTEVVVGFPGSGKSVSRGLKVAHEDAMRGITQFVWDPKGDFLPLKQYAKRMLLDDRKVKLVDLYDANNSVSLDPYAIAEVDQDKDIDEREASALDMLQRLCYEFVNDVQNGLHYKDLLQQAVALTLAGESHGTPPTMQETLGHIRAWRSGDFSKLSDLHPDKHSLWEDLARMLDQHLSSVEKMTLGRLLFRDPTGAGTMRVTEGDLIIFVAIKMQTTEPGDEPTRTSSVADVVSGLMVDFIRSMLYTLPDEVSKSLIFDEWHVIKRSNRAEPLLDWLRRMGRSKRCMVRQMSQSATDFSKGSLSTVWCGYAQNDEEAQASCELLDMEPTEHNKSLLQSLSAGQFLFRDVLGRIALVQVDIWDSWLLSKFNTQAKAKAEILADLAAQGDTDAQKTDPPDGPKASGAA